jgi:predicted acylesterase/phospholipase RssA
VFYATITEKCSHSHRWWWNQGNNRDTRIDGVGKFAGHARTAEQMYRLYVNIGPRVFTKSLRTLFWPLTLYRYENEPFIAALRESLGDVRMGDFWSKSPQTDVVITTFDLKLNSTRFIKPWKKEYLDWPAYRAVLASSSVPTYFPVLEGRYVDGGVGSYTNPCYLAAYELKYCLRWDPAETTLISLGTGRAPYDFTSDEANKKWPWEWLQPIMGAFQQSADDQQVHLVKTFFEKLDFRRFQVNLNQDIPMDDISQIPRLTVYGDELGKKLLSDQIDYAQMIRPKQTPEYSHEVNDATVIKL